MLKNRKIFLSVLGLYSQPMGCKSKSITTQPPHSYMVEEGAYGQTPNLDHRKNISASYKKVFSKWYILFHIFLNTATHYKEIK